MSMTNCVNCGAAKDVKARTCPFCGTSYFDMTDIDLDGRHMVVLRVKMPGGKQVIQMKAFPRFGSIDFGPSYDIEVTSLCDSGRRYLAGPPEVTAAFEFNCVGDFIVEQDI